MKTKNTLLLGTRKGLVTFRNDDKNQWKLDKTHFIGQPVSMAYSDPSDHTWWAALDHGHWGSKLHRSADQGKTWEEITAPAYPEGEEITDGVPATLRYIWAIARGSDNGSSTLMLGTEPGGLFVSTDAGKTFELNRPLWDQPTRKKQWFGGGRDYPGIHSIIVDPRDPSHIYLGISCAGVFETRDAGKSWAPRNTGLSADFMPDPSVDVGHDPHLLVACPKNPDVLWQQNHCGIFRSTDGSGTWQAVSKRGDLAHFGFTIAVKDDDPDTAWVVPAVSDETRVAVDGALCVCRTTDGGKSWQAFRKGLPQANCYDIVYRHGLALNENFLAFGTTTGNLYLSSDYGETWDALGNNLPLIYCAYFV